MLTERRAERSGASRSIMSQPGTPGSSRDPQEFQVAAAINLDPPPPPLPSPPPPSARRHAVTFGRESARVHKRPAKCQPEATRTRTSSLNAPDSQLATSAGNIPKLARRAFVSMLGRTFHRTKPSKLQHSENGMFFVEYRRINIDTAVH